MKATVAHLRILIERLLEKSGEHPTPKGFQKIADAMDERVSSRYIYDYIYRKIKGKEDGDKIELRDASLNALCEYIESKDYKTFEASLKLKKNPQLETCVGNYYSYIRMNATETVLLRSPVRIYYEEGKYFLEQKGPRNVFRGEIKSTRGCLFILLVSGEGKEFFHTYKIGVMTSPRVVQGIFSGVSSTFDPIGGRVVLIRLEEEYTSLAVKQIKNPGKDTTLKTLFGYFKEYRSNNLFINGATTMALNDLKK